MVNIIFNFDLFNNYYYFYERLLVLIFSLVPSLLLVGAVLYSDRKSKEPVKNILICLLSGFLTISLSSYLENLVMPYFANNVLLTYVWAFIEELSKIVIFMLFIFDNKHYDDLYDGIVYMTLIALSFAGLENIMYAFSESTISSSISLALMRDFTTIPLHVICGVVIGYFISLANFSKDKTKRYINFLLVITIPTLLHGTFNNLMSALSNINVNSNSSFNIIVFEFIPLILIMFALFLVAFICIKKNKDLNKIYLSNEKYDDKHNYLMKKDEYLNSYYNKKRMHMYNKTNFFKKGKNLKFYHFKDVNIKKGND